MRVLRSLLAAHWQWPLGCFAIACGSATEPAREAPPPSRIANVTPDATASPTAAKLRSTTASSNAATAPSPSIIAVAAPTQTNTSNVTETPALAAFDPGLANLDPSDDFVVGPPDAIPDCEERLKAAGVHYRVAQLPLRRQKGFVCGAPQVVEYLDGPEHIRFRPRPLVTCQLALGLAHLERVIDRTAVEMLGAKVTSVTQGGTYSCRSMARFRLVSEHSYANAIDLYSFGLSDARTASVRKHFGDPKREAATAEGRFLRALAQRAYDENVFSVVVTRYFDEIHRDHIHVDMSHYRTDGSR